MALCGRVGDQNECLPPCFESFFLQRGIFPISSMCEEERDTPSTSSDDDEMLQLSISIQQQSLSTVASNVHILCYSLWYLAGGDKRERIRSFKHKIPLIFLRKHEALRKRAQGIAKMMEWDTTIDPLMLDGPVKRDLIKEACEVGGCDVNIVTFKGGWLEPAYWLARLWKAAGEVPVDKQKWDKAVAATADIEYLSII
ncbi:uncharacterized protein EV420DRAFT_1635186 [Desarmillaria tabescens]|uniref:Uncharacterized protein n=1 Tax=Armillaria tabescens TaxID=1929756 RepID=A0AA39NM11_ARMTA|nr:uncharacterized protein EV420DRAFT_1635186 [Desarmillaria tabescens]KAK0467918.1 hypothetical protein EV420DRAFT_1635186 [Desarmillaria tabescens]